jgi:hypothetical protein
MPLAIFMQPSPATTALTHRDFEPSSNHRQGMLMSADDWSSQMTNTTKAAALTLAAQPAERRRTVVAIVSASIISLVVWGLIVALKIQ